MSIHQEKLLVIQ